MIRTKRRSPAKDPISFEDAFVAMMASFIYEVEPLKLRNQLKKAVIKLSRSVHHGR